MYFYNYKSHTINFKKVNIYTIYNIYYFSHLNKDNLSKSYVLFKIMVTNKFEKIGKYFEKFENNMKKFENIF